jgi:hypothetical protein
MAFLSWEEFEDTKGVIRTRISKKNRQHNGQKKKYKKDKQWSTKHTYKTKDRVTRTPLQIDPDWGYFEWTEQIISINPYKLMQTFFVMILENIFIFSK